MDFQQIDHFNFSLFRIIEIDFDFTDQGATDYHAICDISDNPGSLGIFNAETYTNRQTGIFANQLQFLFDFFGI